MIFLSAMFLSPKPKWFLAVRGSVDSARLCDDERVASNASIHQTISALLFLQDSWRCRQLSEDIDENRVRSYAPEFCGVPCLHPEDRRHQTASTAHRGDRAP